MATEVDFAVRESDASMLGQLLAASLPQTAAKCLLDVKFPEAWDRDAQELAAKNNAGVISDAELRRLDNYVHVGDLLTILQLEARKTIARGNGTV